MLNIGDINAAYDVWIAAGLKPPQMDKTGQQIIAQKTLEQYKYTQIEDWAEAVEWVANNNTRWVTWFDINNALAIVRQNKAGQENKAIERTNKAASGFVKKLFADLKAGIGFSTLRKPVSEETKMTGRRLFPDCSDAFIERNEIDLINIKNYDRHCTECSGGNDCPFSGHQPFLIVDKCSGYTVPMMDRERCYKYHPAIPDTVSKQISARRQGALEKNLRSENDGN